MGLPEALAEALEEEPLDLVRAALLLGRVEGSEADPQASEARLEEMAEALRTRLSDVPEGLARLDALNRYFFDELGFQGNVEDYYDPRNSFLAEVLDRKTGLPITLSLVYMEVGRRVGVPLQGVGFPGHFIVRYDGGEESVFLDPFRGGRVLSPEDLQGLLEGVYGRPIAVDPAFLRPATDREILARMLRNLKGIYTSSEEFNKLVEVLDALLRVEPASSLDRRDRGLVHYEMGRFREAQDDLEAYLEAEPEAGDAEVIRAHLEDIESRLRMYR